MTEKGLVTPTSALLESPLKPEVREHTGNASPGGSSGGVSATPRASGALSKSDIESLIAKEYVGLRLLIARRTGDVNVAADLLNDAVCTTWEKWQAGQIERPEQIAGYIFKVAMNMLRNRRRTKAERPELRANAKALDSLEQDAPGAEGIEESLAAQVRKLLQSMDLQRDRLVLVRFYLNEEDKETICRDMELTPVQFARVLHRAHGRLRKRLESGGVKGSDLFSCLLVM